MKYFLSEQWTDKLPTTRFFWLDAIGDKADPVLVDALDLGVEVWIKRKYEDLRYMPTNIAVPAKPTK